MLVMFCQPCFSAHPCRCTGPHAGGTCRAIQRSRRGADRAAAVPTSPKQLAPPRRRATLAPTLTAAASAL